MPTRFERLASIETNFFNNNTTRLAAFDYSKNAERVQGYFYTPRTDHFYYSEAQTKKRIVLHFTAGNLLGDMNQLSIQDYPVSVPFVIARDGKIYQFFFSKFWSHHLGLSNGNPAKIYDRQSIGIELSNYGWLNPVGQTLETIYSRQINPSTGQPNPVDTYCNLVDTSAYQKLNTDFRTHSFYASYTQPQIESLIVLVRYLCELYSIPKQFLAEDRRFLTSKANMDFNGIVSHINYRSSGKWDIGPAFDWNALISGVQATQFMSVINPVQNTRGATPVQSEQEFTQGKTTGSKFNKGRRTRMRAYDPYNWETP